MAFDFRTALLAAFLLTGIASVDTVWAESSAAADPRDVQQAATEDPMVCKRFTPTGSRIVRRFCYKQSEWNAMREGGQRAARDSSLEHSQYGYRGVAPSTNTY